MGLINKFKMFIVLLFLISCSSNNESARYMYDVMTLVNSVEVRGTYDNPIYDINDILYFRNNYYILDRNLMEVKKYNQDGEFITKWGREGSGPGEFLSPEHFVADEEDDICIIDGPGSFKLICFNSNGDYKNSLSLNSFGPFTSSKFIDINNQKYLLLTTIVQCTHQPYNNCVIQLHDFENQEFLNFAHTEKVEPGAIGLPFYSTILKDYIYIVHVYGTSMSIFDLDGNYITEVNLNNSPHIVPLNTSNLPNDVIKQVEELNKRSYTFISGMFTNEEYIFIEYTRRGDTLKMSDSMKFLIVYNKNGKIIHNTLELQDNIFQIIKNKIYAFYYDEDTEYGNLKINIYTTD